MKVKISIQQTFALDDYMFEDMTSDTSSDIKIDYAVNRFEEDINYMVKYNEVIDNVLIEYIEED